MHRMTTRALALAAALAAAPAATFAAGPARPKLAVLELKAGQGLDQKVGQSLSAVLTADAARTGFEVVSQADVTAMLSFQRQRQLLGCTDDGCLAELGGALGVDFVLSGEVARIGSRDHVALALLDPKRAKVVARSAGFSDAGDDALALAALARFRGLVRQERPDLLVKAPPIEAPGAARLASRRAASRWVLGAGALVLAAGAGTGLVARRQATDLEGAWQRPDYASRYDRQRRTALVADVLLGAGALTAGVGGWLWLTSQPRVVAIPVAGGAPGLTVAGVF